MELFLNNLRSISQGPIHNDTDPARRLAARAAPPSAPAPSAAGPSPCALKLRQFPAHIPLAGLSAGPWALYPSAPPSSLSASPPGPYPPAPPPCGQLPSLRLTAPRGGPALSGCPPRPAFPCALSAPGARPPGPLPRGRRAAAAALFLPSGPGRRWPRAAGRYARPGCRLRVHAGGSLGRARARAARVGLSSPQGARTQLGLLTHSQSRLSCVTVGDQAELVGIIGRRQCAAHLWGGICNFGGSVLVGNGQWQ